MGLVPGDEHQRSEILLLGTVVENEFCQTIKYRGNGELRIYNALAKIKGTFEEVLRVESINAALN